MDLKEGRNGTLSQILRIFKQDVLPSLGKSPLYDIHCSNLRDAIDRIAQRKAFTASDKVRA